MHGRDTGKNKSIFPSTASVEGTSPRNDRWWRVEGVSTIPVELYVSAPVENLCVIGQRKRVGKLGEEKRRRRKKKRGKDDTTAQTHGRSA